MAYVGTYTYGSFARYNEKLGRLRVRQSRTFLLDARNIRRVCIEGYTRINIAGAHATGKGAR